MGRIIKIFKHHPLFVVYIWCFAAILERRVEKGVGHDCATHLNYSSEADCWCDCMNELDLLHLSSTFQLIAPFSKHQSTPLKSNSTPGSHNRSHNGKREYFPHILLSEIPFRSSLQLRTGKSVVRIGRVAYCSLC